jgi:hypothetical protein
MKGTKEGMLFPLPWAQTAATNFLVTPNEMRKLLEEAGLEITHDEDRREIALEHHRNRLAHTNLQTRVSGL